MIIHLHILCSPHKNSTTILHGSSKVKFQLYMETQENAELLKKKKIPE